MGRKATKYCRLVSRSPGTPFCTDISSVSSGHGNTGLRDPTIAVIPVPAILRKGFPAR